MNLENPSLLCSYYISKFGFDLLVLARIELYVFAVNIVLKRR